MAKITRSLSRRIVNDVSEIMLRLTISRTNQVRLKSGIYVNPSRFKDGRFIYPRANQKEAAKLHDIETRLQDLESHIIEFCISSHNEKITKEMLELEIDKFNNPDKYAKPSDDTHEYLFKTLEKFISLDRLSLSSKGRYHNLARTLLRFEAYMKTKDASYHLSLLGYTPEDTRNFIWFLQNEYTLYDEYFTSSKDYPDFLRCAKKVHKTTQRSNNTIISIIKLISVFFNWCVSKEILEKNPIGKCLVGMKEEYGTPFYMTIEERNKVAEFDLSEYPQLEVQRDIFIFQCLVGCRVSDLYLFKSDNISDGFLQYIPQKTMKESKKVVRVPLKPQAKEIIERYKNTPNRLFPCVTLQAYNKAIKRILELCGIDRVVTIINPKTGKDERKPIYEVASSHMARRTFIGNLYKKVKDPNLVGSMSGHKEGSKAFARYREIDDDIKRDVIDLI